MQIVTSLASLAAIGSVVSLGACAYVQHAKFGALPEGDRLALIERSPNYVGAEFRNTVPTPMFTEDSSFVRVLVGNLFASTERVRPSGPMPSVKTDFNALDKNQDTVIWLGHSSYFVQLGGKRILIDPVFSPSAAPLPNVNRAFEGSSVFTAEDMPEIDYLLITHDHWDHLDYPSVTALAQKTKMVIAGLGVGGYFEHWRYPKGKIREADWFSALQVEPDLTIHVLPARHYSGRLLTKNKTLWVGYALETSDRRVFFSGDSGAGPHIAEIAERFEGFDLAVLDSGQYDRRWAHIHMTPKEAAEAAQTLKAKALLPAHVGKFALARHSWNEPFRGLEAASAGKRYALLTPRIGEPIVLGNPRHHFARWWQRLE
jgi:L-ascorbate metabolism protein UlaG (beta-lactamase superfamily)